jgi:carnitine O-octanoyltransferase
MVLGCIGEHSLYDGTISVSYSFYILLSLLEEPEPNWNETPSNILVPRELKFDIDQKLRSEVFRMDKHCKELRNSIIVKCSQFEKYGKSFMKTSKIHPDAYIQSILMWTYYKLHGQVAPTYETATMRVYYHGRTETVRSCSEETVQWIKAMQDSKISVRKIIFILL